VFILSILPEKRGIILKGYIPAEEIEEVKARANIVDVVSEYVTLKKTGRNFVGLCPFHREKTPSFTVNSEKQIFYCFGCGEGGNAISFLMKISNMSFPESVRHLAAKLGITIPVRQMSEGEKKFLSEKEKFSRINQMAAERFRKNLSSDMGEVARDYLKKRGIDNSVVKGFGLGYSPEGWRRLKDYFSNMGILLELVRKAGLVITNDNGQSYDRFRGRLIFPIVDLNGNIVAFGGRGIGNEEPKYLNSPESPVYIKGNTLYGLYQTKGEISKKNNAIIVEGYLDLLSLWSVGTRNVVATLGTALTRNQVELIRRFTRNVSIIFDPDEAGRSAVERSLKLFLEEEMHARVVILPEGYDPDDYVRKFGREALENVIVQSPPMVDYYIEKIIGGDNTLEENLDSVKDSISFIRNISNLVQRNLFIKRVSEKLGIDQGLMKDEVNKALVGSQKFDRQGESPKKGTEKIDIVELSLIHMIMEYPDRIPVVVNEKIFGYFLSKGLRGVGEALIESFDRGEIKNISDMMNDLPDSSIKEELLKLAMVERPFNREVIDRVLYDTIKKIRLKWYKKRHKSIQGELIKAQRMGDTGLCERLVMEKGRLLEEEKMLQA
jgi:DNA primase